MRKGYKKKSDENWIKEENVKSWHVKAGKALKEAKAKESKEHLAIYDHPETVRAKVIKPFKISEAFEVIDIT